MFINVLETAEKSALKYPDKTAFADDKASVSWSGFISASKKIGTALLNAERRNRPVAVLIDKSVSLLTAMAGVVYSGNFYVVVDTKMPIDRIETTFDTLKPVGIVTDLKNLELAKSIKNGGEVYEIESLLNSDIDEKGLALVRGSAIDTDPVYALFTSGSTGVPKGAVVSHRAVLSYANWVCETFGINSETVFGSQTPFYFSMSVLDIFSVFMSGATLQIIPKAYFSFPVKLLEFMQEREVNTIYWVPSALCLVSNWKALGLGAMPKLQKILFAGEVMPTKQLNDWIRHYPDALFANLYGPTEVTDICAYYVVDRSFRDGESLPIGRACRNCGLLLLTEDNREAKNGEEGELCVRGSFLAHGYYNNRPKTDAAFTENPLNPHYPEMIYRTGDLASYNEKGELIYLGRKDFQIKRMGYRIETGEIEAAVSAVDGVKSCVCIYDAQDDKLVMIYEGKKLSEKELLTGVESRLPKYMYPNEWIRVRQMKYNPNGKIDRKWYKESYKELCNG